jgi:hypothetical protein
MIPGKIKAGDEELAFTIPTNWSEISFWQLCQLQAAGEEATALQSLAILSSVEYAIWADVPLDVASLWYAKMAKYLTTDTAPKWDELQPCFQFQLGRKMITLPESSGKVPAGAIETIRAIMMQYQGDSMPMQDVVLCFALLCVKPYFGTYGDDGEEKAEKLIEQVKAIPAVIARPTINFFLQIWHQRPSSGPNGWQRLLRILNWRQE